MDMNAIFNFVLLLIIVGAVLYIVKLLPIDETIKKVIQVVVIIIVLVMALKMVLFGMGDIRIGR